MMAARHVRARGKERQLHLSEIEGIERPDPHLPTTERKTLSSRFAAGQQMQILHRKLTLFEQFDQRFADVAGGADHGDIDGLTHELTYDTEGAAL